MKLHSLTLCFSGFPPISVTFSLEHILLKVCFKFDVLQGFYPSSHSVLSGDDIIHFRDLHWDLRTNIPKYVCACPHLEVLYVPQSKYAEQSSLAPFLPLCNYSTVSFPCLCNKMPQPLSNVQRTQRVSDTFSVLSPSIPRWSACVISQVCVLLTSPMDLC